MVGFGLFSRQKAREYQTLAFHLEPCLRLRLRLDFCCHLACPWVVNRAAFLQFHFGLAAAQRPPAFFRPLRQSRSNVTPCSGDGVLAAFWCACGRKVRNNACVGQIINMTGRRGRSATARTTQPRSPSGLLIGRSSVHL